MSFCVFGELYSRIASDCILLPFSTTKNDKKDNKARFLHSINKALVSNNISRADGFTLIEIMIVVLIIGILMATAMMNSMIAKDRARVAACKATMETVKKGMETYITEHATYPEQGMINSYQNIITVLNEEVNLTDKITCEEPFIYTTSPSGTTYRLETQVHYIGASSHGVRIIIDNGSITEQPL